MAFIVVGHCKSGYRRGVTSESSSRTHTAVGNNAHRAAASALLSFTGVLGDAVCTTVFATRRISGSRYDGAMTEPPRPQCQWKGPRPGQWARCEASATHQHAAKDETEAALDGLVFCSEHRCPLCRSLPHLALVLVVPDAQAQLSR